MSATFPAHCCQFYRPPISAINCLAYDKTTKKIALSRADSCIEIWTLKPMPPCRERILPYVDNASVEALAWCRGRLFATGLDGFLREWSIDVLWPVNMLKVTPSAAWCMAANRSESHLAIGTEEGALYLIAVTPENVHLEKCLTRSGDRILSIAWSQDGRTIVTGSVGIVRVWDILSGRCVSRMTVSQSQADMKTLIWSIAVTKDSVIVTGDSRGVTSFWDHQTATQINSYQSHTADVLSVCWSEERNLVFSTGIEPAICQYHAVEEPIKNKRQILGDATPSSSAWTTTADVRRQFVENIRLNLHTHDVRCLLAAEEWLVSGGVDGVLTFSKYPPKTILKFYPFCSDNISVAAKGKRMLFQYPEYLELWRLGATEAQASGEDGKFLPIAKEPEKLAQIKCKSGSRILCSAVDESGQVIAYSDGRITNVYYVKEEGDANDDDKYSVVIQPIKCLNATLPGASAMIFATPTSMFLADENRAIQRVEIDDVICRLEPVVEPQGKTLVRKIACNRNKRQIATITTDNKVTVIDCHELKIFATLPPFDALAIDAKFSTSCDELLILCADGRLFEFDLSADRSSNWDKRSPVLPWPNTMAEAGPLGFAISSLNNDDRGIVVYGDNKLVFVPQSGTRKIQQSTSIPNRFHHICKVELLEDGSLVIVQVDEDRYLADLPPSLKVKKYGTG